MPRRIPDYAQQFADWNMIASIGAFWFGASQLLFLYAMIQCARGKGEKAPARPWDGATANIPCWVRRQNGETFQVFAINCTHLGCPVRWFEESHLFMCPCHGGAFYQDGSHASGPPPRGLYQYKYKVENGQLWVRGGVLPTLAEPL